MTIKQQIETYIAAQPDSKRSDMEFLHHAILQQQDGVQLWFLDGRNAENKVIANPNIGYGRCEIAYADERAREFYRVGMSANGTGISVYFMCFRDKNYLSNTYGHQIGKAKITGYCIKFKSLPDIDIQVLLHAINNAFTHS